MENSIEELYLKNDTMYNEQDVLTHYGTPRHSGRYPWGSGDDPYQRTGDFLSRYQGLKDSGLSEKEIADALEMSTTELRTAKGIANAERRKLVYQQIKSLQEDGLSKSEIGRRLNMSESSVRSMLNAESASRMNKAAKLADNLKSLCDDKGIIDVGKGTELQLNCSREKLAQSLTLLENEGYVIYDFRVPQATNPNQYTRMKVLAPPGTEYKDVYDFDKIHQIEGNYITRDEGDSISNRTFEYPSSLDSKRVMVRYRDDGGLERDGTIEIRRGVKDLDLGESNYAQIRVLVDGTHYMKGMAIYSDGSDMPKGVDVIFNTNKVEGTPMCGESKTNTVLKHIKKDPDNPFGSLIKEVGGQSYYNDPNGKYTDPVTGEKQSLSLINKRSEEGDWGAWSKELPAQFLSKQPQRLINQQLNLSISNKQDEFDEIMKLTNPVVKRSLLDSFADDCDAVSISLKAAALPGQKYQVILPLTTINEHEVYAPNFKDSSEIALIRYPHAGTFEIPILKVNNRIQEGKAKLGTNPLDAVGISSAVAERLSGADFDGDTVMCIPITPTANINSTKPLKGLQNFDTKMSYGPDEIKVDNTGVEHYYRAGREFRVMKDTQKQMGVISNLISDMSIMGADSDEMARAVRHSMVVIDAEKHKLDYKQSEIDNGVKDLHNKYQRRFDPETGTVHAGARTLISASKSEKQIKEIKPGIFVHRKTGKELQQLDDDSYIDTDTGEVFKKKDKVTKLVNPETGEKYYHETGRSYYTYTYKDSNGKSQKSSVIEKDDKYYYKDKDTKKYIEISPDKLKLNTAMVSMPKMTLTKDARTLSTGTPQEEAYAEYANRMKSLANEARKASINTIDTPYSPSARVAYQEECNSLKEKLNTALLNAPKERKAQTIAASIVKVKKQSNPHMTSEELKKLNQMELTKARAKVGAHRVGINITDKEWAAIQAGAISTSKLKEIIRFADSTRVRELATPRNTTVMSSARISRIKSMVNSGYTTAEIAEALGCSASTVIKYIK